MEGLPENLNKVFEMEDGRWKNLFITVQLKETCLKCASFNQNYSLSKGEGYRCACPPTCIGETVSSRMKNYIFNKIKELDLYPEIRGLKKDEVS